MKKNKYKIKFYTIKGNKFTRVCTRTKLSMIKFVIKTAIHNLALFKVVKCNK